MPNNPKTVLITGAGGFIGKNLAVSLEQAGYDDIIKIDIDKSREDMEDGLRRADFVFHLAGVNRPEKKEEFLTGNTQFTEELVHVIERLGRAIPVAFTSSIQVDLDNDYGRSKRLAEKVLTEYAERNKAQLFIFRLPNVFGKWCRPNYNSVVSTFCHNIAHGKDITVHDANVKVSLVYIDTVTAAFIRLLGEESDIAANLEYYRPVDEVFTVSVGELADTIRYFKKCRSQAVVPDTGDSFRKYLYSTYLSYVDPHELSMPLTTRCDDRGKLVEVLKSERAGQVFFSTSNTGVVRGNHYHNTKVEKFCIVQGTARIRLKHILSGDVITYDVSGEEVSVVDIPPGYTHSLTNTSDGQMIALFWANEIFDKDRPDTFYLEA